MAEGGVVRQKLKHAHCGSLLTVPTASGGGNGRQSDVVERIKDGHMQAVGALIGPVMKAARDKPMLVAFARSFGKNQLVQLESTGSCLRLPVF